MLRHAVFAAVVFAPTLASAQLDRARADEGADETPSLTWVIERARALDAEADYVPAAELYEVYAEACLDTATAVLERGSPCDEIDEALARAFELRRALGDRLAAAHDAEMFGVHFLYANPRRAMQVRYQVVRMQLDADELDAAEATLDDIDASTEGPSARQAVVADGFRALIAAARGEMSVAMRAWRRLDARYQRDRAAIEEDGPVPLEWVIDAVAEARLVRAETLAERFFEMRTPRAHSGQDDARWWSTVSPWLTRSRRRLVLARVAMERVYELGSVRHSVIAAARIGELYTHQADMLSALQMPPSETLRALVGEGLPRPGYDEARAHFEICVAWAARNGVARDWSERCIDGLHALDPHSYPLQAELVGEALYHPASQALPHAVE